VNPWSTRIRRKRRGGPMCPPGGDAQVAAYDRVLVDALHRVWGFSDFRPLQRDAMHAILASRDSVVVLPTGGGKSLCFQAPAIVELDQGLGALGLGLGNQGPGAGGSGLDGPAAPKLAMVSASGGWVEPPRRRGVAVVVS